MNSLLLDLTRWGIAPSYSARHRTSVKGKEVDWHAWQVSARRNLFITYAI